MKKEKEAIEPVVYTRGIVLHSDGSAQPNPGYAGWGIHGYLYEDRVPTKGTGNPDYVVTSNDYMTKVDKVTQPNIPVVSPVMYIDGMGGVPPDPDNFNGSRSTNNAGELMGIIEALKVTLQHDVQKIRLWTDSEYVTKGFNNALRWRQNKWLKPDGQPPRNLAAWQECMTLLDEVKAKGLDFAINWNKGHSGNLGNEIVDSHAYVGMRRATNNMFERTIDESLPDGYWKYESNKHPFISHRRMYYNTLFDTNVPGIYCLGEHDKDDDLAGKRMANGAYAYVHLDEPEKVLEAVREHSCAVADGDDTIMVARVDYIYRADIHELLHKYGNVIMREPPRTPSRLNAIGQDLNEIITREHNPPLLIERCVKELAQLREILTDYQSGNTQLVTTDLTPLIYESLIETSKKGEVKTSIKLRPEFIVGMADMEAKVGYRHPDGSLRQTDIHLMLGLDLLDRNALRRLEELEPEVRLVTWLEEPSAFRFATIIKVKGAIGIWAGTYSNLRLILD